jgi:membrane protease YdiL (CAAX protease family)
MAAFAVAGEVPVKRVGVATLLVLAYVAAVLVVTMLVMGLTKIFIGDWEAGGPQLELAGEGLLTVLGILITNLLLRWLGQSHEMFRGWPALRTSLGWFAKGGLAGLLMAGAMLSITLALRGGRLVFGDGDLPAYVRYVIPLGGYLLIAALAEEWFFRGYPLLKLASVLGRGWANLVMAVLFAVAHLGTPGSNLLVSINIVLGSLVVGSLRFTPGGIPAAWGFHFVWNYVQVLCGATLSLEYVDVPGVTFAASGSTFFSGGVFGPEASIGATIATIPVLVVLAVYFRRRGLRDVPY